MSDESWQERRDQLAGDHADALTPQSRDELWWMRSADFKSGYDQGRADLWNEVKNAASVLKEKSKWLDRFVKSVEAWSEYYAESPMFIPEEAKKLLKEYEEAIGGSSLKK